MTRPIWLPSFVSVEGQVVASLRPRAKGSTLGNFERWPKVATAKSEFPQIELGAVCWRGACRSEGHGVRLPRWGTRPARRRVALQRAGRRLYKVKMDFRFDDGLRSIFMRRG